MPKLYASPQEEILCLRDKEVNTRRYTIEALIGVVEGVVDGPIHQRAIIRILEAEKRDILAEHNAWKKANGYA